MKKLTKIKLSELGKAELEHREMNHLKGGCTTLCRCACTGASDAQSTLNSNDSSGTKDTVDSSKHHCACSTFDECNDPNCPTYGGGY